MPCWCNLYFARGCHSLATFISTHRHALHTFLMPSGSSYVLSVRHVHSGNHSKVVRYILQFTAQYVGQDLTDCRIRDDVRAEVWRKKISTSQKMFVFIVFFIWHTSVNVPCKHKLFCYRQVYKMKIIKHVSLQSECFHAAVTRHRPVFHCRNDNLNH